MAQKKEKNLLHSWQGTVRIIKMGGGEWHEDPNHPSYDLRRNVPANNSNNNLSLSSAEIGENENKEIDAQLNKLIKRQNQAPSNFKPSTNVSVPTAVAYQNARRLLSQRLRLYDVVEYTIPGDGSCQFASLSDQLFRNLKRTNDLRYAAVKQLQEKPEYYIEFVHTTNYLNYCNNMIKSSTWGDHLTLQALADRLHIVINLLTSYSHTPHVEIRPRGSEPIKRHVWLSFFGEVHYNSLYPTSKIQERRNADSSCSIC